MRLPIKPWHIPARVAVGAFILNSGYSKVGADDDTARGLHGMATAVYPFLSEIDPRTFTRNLSRAEMVLGAALLSPVVPTGLAGAGLTGFSSALFGLYLRTPGMRQENSLRPTTDGTALAKDVWLVGIGLSFVVDAALRKCSKHRC